LGRRRGGRLRGRGRFVRGPVEQLDLVGPDGGDEDVLGDELRERAARLAGEDVDGRDPLARVDTDARRSTAVDDGGEHLLVGDAGAEPVDGLGAGQVGDPLRDGVDAAAGHGDDLVALGRRRELQPSAPAVGSRADGDGAVGDLAGGHRAAPQAALYSASNERNSSVLPARRIRYEVISSVTTPRMRITRMPTAK